MITMPRCLASAAFLVAVSGSAASAAQVVVLDETWVHAPDLADSHYRVMPMAGAPANWVSPVDYSQGKAYVYLEVHSKPTAQPTKFQVCFEATPTYACTDQSPTYTEVGVYEWETNFANFWSPPGEFVDWTLGVNKIACILKDTMNNKPSADNVGPEMAALYTPTEVRMVVTLVEAGGVYIPPTPSGEGSTGGDESGSSSDAGTTAAGSTTGELPGGTSTTTSAIRPRAPTARAAPAASSPARQRRRPAAAARAGAAARARAATGPGMMHPATVAGAGRPRARRRWASHWPGCCWAWSVAGDVGHPGCRTAKTPRIQHFGTEVWKTEPDLNQFRPAEGDRVFAHFGLGRTGSQTLSPAKQPERTSSHQAGSPPPVPTAPREART